jgi:hydrogenase maturation protein HypF
VSTRSPVLPRRRARVRVFGTVQGVGFRPYVYRLAGEFDLSGFVLNDSCGVVLEVEGADAAVASFLASLALDAPRLAAVERLEVTERELTGARGFEIRDSDRAGVAEAQVTPDSATCEQCLAEVFDPSDRRHRYPFTNCTNCGPRFTIIREVPYDRPATTMAAFEMCDLCQAEYDDPSDRRFHAQPNACPVCGPQVALLDRDGVGVSDAGAVDLIDAAALALRSGAIVAVKGIGGFHLACRADDEDAVAALRARKHREDRPLALMTGSPEAAGRLVELGELERELLCSPARPIVLAGRVPGAAVAPSVAPRSRELGVMLPYSPLHHLLLHDADVALVMTSGNVSDEPIAYTDEDAMARLLSIADLFLLHDRPIQTRTDDSVVRVVALGGRRRGAILRRSRGYVPSSLPLPAGTGAPLLACGAEQKNTFCLARGGRAWVGHHIGDLENYETLRSFAEGIDHFERLFAVTPELVAHDMHPEYLSTKYALERDGVRTVAVQHHHAHMAACLAEHAVAEDAVGAVFDGTGYGTDGTIWGGEILFGGLAAVERVGLLTPVQLPGGARAIREPWRMACAWLAVVVGEDAAIPPTLRDAVAERSWRAVQSLLRAGAHSPVTTSMGRLFDAVAALCGLCPIVNYEGQAAVELEAACDPRDRGGYPLELRDTAAGLVLDARESVRAVLEDVERGTAVGVIASRFHAAVAHATVAACVRTASARGSEAVVLSGGVFQNRRLLEATDAGLRAAGLRVLTPRLLPANDGGISYGQAAVAAAQIGESR